MMPIRLPEAVASLRPGAEFFMGLELSSLVWLDRRYERPTDEEIIAEFDRLSAAVVPEAPQSVTPRQARLALLQAGLLDQVQAAVDAAGGATKITWEFATTIERNSPLIETLGGSLGLTSEQVDTLFRFASTL